MSLSINKIFQLWGKGTIVSVRRRKSRRRSSYLKHKVAARALVCQKIAQFNAVYNFKVGRVAIRNQRSRWGSCSKLGNLNFNYKIVFLPEPLVDYLVVHELCHLGEFNHSPRFWALVSRTIPDYRARRQALKRNQIDNISL